MPLPNDCIIYYGLCADCMSESEASASSLLYLLYRRFIELYSGSSYCFKRSDIWECWLPPRGINEDAIDEWWRSFCARGYVLGTYVLEIEDWWRGFCSRAWLNDTWFMDSLPNFCSNWACKLSSSKRVGFSSRFYYSIS